MSGLTAGTYFIVIKVNDTSNSGGNKFGTAGSGSHYPFNNGLIYDGWGSNTRRDAIASSATITAWHIWHGHSAANDWAIYQNGTLLHSDASNTVTFPAVPLIGENLNGGGDSLRADIAGVYLFSEKLSSGDNTAMLEWIADKFGITI